MKQPYIGDAYNKLPELKRGEMRVSTPNKVVHTSIKVGVSRKKLQDLIKAADSVIIWGRRPPDSAPCSQVDYDEALAAWEKIKQSIRTKV